MFTGLIEKVCKVKALEKTAENLKIGIDIDLDANIGDSLSINGVCLTLVKKESNIYFFDVSKETLKRSNIGYLKIGDYVNVERALLPTSRLGGHILQGHVDFVSNIKSFSKVATHRELRIELFPDFKKFFVEKGSIGIDGISLTINYVFDRELSINIIPHTFENTNLKYKKVGDKVNIEIDIIGKYVINYIENIRKREDNIKSFFGYEI